MREIRNKKPRYHYRNLIVTIERGTAKRFNSCAHNAYAFCEEKIGKRKQITFNVLSALDTSRSYHKHLTPNTIRNHRCSANFFFPSVSLSLNLYYAYRKTSQFQTVCMIKFIYLVQLCNRQNVKMIMKYYLNSRFLYNGFDIFVTIQKRLVDL